MIVLIALFLWGVRWLLGFSGPSVNHLPRYNGWPIIGNLLQVGMQRTELTFTKWSKKLGGVFAVTLLNNSFVILNSFDAIYEVLVTKGDKFAGRPQEKNYRIQLVSENFNNIIFSNPNSRWKMTRKLCHRQIKMYDTGMKRIEELNIEIIADLVRQFRKHESKPFNPREAIYNSIMNIISSLLISKKYTTADEEFKMLTQVERLATSTLAVSGEGVELDIFPWLRFFGNRTYGLIKTQIFVRNKLWAAMKGQAIRTMGEHEEENRREGVVHALLRVYENQPDGPTKDEVHL